MFLLFTIVPVSALNAGNLTSYSFVHISDTQNLVFYPETYDYTFSYLDSIKECYNISAIIITGDLVTNWNDKKEWDTYSDAKHETSIPVYVIAGNHDTNYGQNYQYYTQYTGNAKNSYVITFENFDLVGINYLDSSLKPEEFAVLRHTLMKSPKNFTIIATHNYLDKNGMISALGTGIDQQLIVKPTIILSGHVHGAFVRDRMIGEFPVIEDLTNYQDGIPGGSSSENVSVGTFYTITTRYGQVEKISAKIIWISPRQSLDSEHVLYDISVPEPDAEPPLPEITPDCSSVPGICNPPIITKPNDIWTSFWEFLKGLFRFS